MQTCGPVAQGRGGTGRVRRADTGEGEEMGVGTDGRKAQGGFRAGRGHSGEGRREGRAETEDTVVRRNGTGMGLD
jgi:hypothetical protein